MKVAITHIDTACCLIELGGSRLLTDPAFDAPGKWYHHGFGAFSRKTSTPAVASNDARLNAIDLVLLSHDQHKDNLDSAGRDMLERAGTIVSTPAAARRLSNCQGLRDFESLAFSLRDGSNLKITAVPAQHHPGWLPQFLSGPVVGFVLEHALFKRPLYISGDTVFFKGMERIAKVFQPGLALVHVGSAQFRYLSGPGRFTMNSADFIRAARLFRSETIIPIHNGGWTHFRENNDTLARALVDAEDVQKATRFVVPGETVEFEV